MNRELFSVIRRKISKTGAKVRGLAGDDLVFAAMPKSASQFLESLLMAGLGAGWRSIRCKSVAGGSQMFVSPEVLRRELWGRRQVVCYGHMLYCEHNRQAWASCLNGRRVVVSIRPLADALVSYRDHVDKSRGPVDFRLAGERREGFADWNELSSEEKLSYLVYYQAPWYLNFMEGWLAARDDGWNVEFVKFEELTSDPEAIVSGVVERLDFTLDKSALREAIAKSERKVNFNVGKVGRGQASITKSDHDTLCRLLEFRKSTAAEFGDYLLG